MHNLLKVRLIKMGPSKKYVKKSNWRLLILAFVLGFLTVVHFDAMLKSPTAPTALQYAVTLFVVATIWVLFVKTYVFDGGNGLNMDP